MAVADDADSFPTILRGRLNDFFREQGISPKADSLMIAKIAFGLLSWAVSYAAICVFHLSPATFVAVYVLHGMAHVFLLLNVAHDSNHNAISRNVRVNSALSYVFDLCGISSYVWRILHHGGHHSCINVHGEDEAIEGRRLFRFSPRAPGKKAFRYQHVYALAMYCLFSLDYVFIKDFEYFFFPPQRTLRRAGHKPREYVLLFGGKLFYLFYMIVAPVMLLHYSPWLVACAFLVEHLIAGFLTVIVFQTSHAVTTNYFPRSRSEFDNYVFHILATTSDYSTRSPVATFLTGGLNHHVAHHLCPYVCHTHYPRLTKIIRDSAAEFGVEYREQRTMRRALVLHLTLLKRLGNEI
jgi:linoleoyl-CoA desaturase